MKSPGLQAQRHRAAWPPAPRGSPSSQDRQRRRARAAYDEAGALVGSGCPKMIGEIGAVQCQPYRVTPTRPSCPDETEAPIMGGGRLRAQWRRRFWLRGRSPDPERGRPRHGITLTYWSTSDGFWKRFGPAAFSPPGKRRQGLALTPRIPGLDGDGHQCFTPGERRILVTLAT